VKVMVVKLVFRTAEGEKKQDGDDVGGGGGG